MLDVQLMNAGFYEIAWPTTSKAVGTTYVRPGKRQSVRVFLAHDSCEVEVYAGGLQNGRLVYRGPAQTAANLPLLTLHDN